MKNKNFYRSLVVVIPLQVILTFYGCKENLTSTDKGDLNLSYPTTLHSLSTGQIEQLQKEFDSLNNFKVCTKIDKYGFTGNETYWRQFSSFLGGEVFGNGQIVLLTHVTKKNEFH